MANHLRRQIREAVATAVTGLTTTGSHVFQSRVYTLQATNLPALRISLGAETITPVTIHGPLTQERALQVEINAVHQAVEDLDDALDGILKEVEIAVAGMSLSGLASSVELVSIERPEFEAGSQPIGQTTLIYEAKYYTLANAPDVAV